MPPLIVAAAAVAAEIAVSAALTGAVIAGVTITATTAAIIGSVVGLVISVAGSMLLSQLSKSDKQDLPITAQDRKQAVRSAIEPRRVIYGRSIVSGPVVYMSSSGPDDEFINVVVPVAAHVIDDFEAVWINGVEQPLVPAGTGGIDGQDRGGGGSEDFALFLVDATEVLFGASSPAMSGSMLIHTYDGTQTTADATLISESSGEWTSNHILKGTPYIYTRIQYSSNLYPHGFESIAAVVRGALLFDPRDDSTAWSQNPALAIRDYLLADYGLSCAADEINEPSFEAAANICDELVALDEAETVFQPRFQINGSFKLDQQPADIIEQLLTSCGGTLTYVQGAYQLHVAAYDPPAITLTESDFAGPLQVTTQHSRRDLFNAVRGTFIDPTQKWVASEFPIVTDSDFETADGEQIVVDVEYQFTTDSAMAQRLSRIQLLRHRFGQLTVDAPLKYSAMRLAVWDTVAIDFADFGWTDKVFRVVSWQFDPVTAGIVVRLQEEDSDSYSWTALDAAPPLDTPDSTLADPLIIPPPTGLTITPTTELDSDGHIVPALLAEWSLTPHPFLTASEVQWKKTADSEWSSRAVRMPIMSMVISPVIAGTSYDVRVRAVAGLVRSAWTSTATEDAAPDTTPPADPSGLTATAVRGGIVLDWTNPTDNDFESTLIFENTGTVFGSASYIGHTPGSHFFRSGISGNDPRWYWIQSRDFSGNATNVVGPATATPNLAATADIAAHAITLGDGASQNDTISCDDTATVFIVGKTITVPGGGDVWIWVRADLDTGSLPEGSGGGGSEVQ